LTRNINEENINEFHLKKRRISKTEKKKILFLYKLNSNKLHLNDFENETAIFKYDEFLKITYLNRKNKENILNRKIDLKKGKIPLFPPIPNSFF